MFKVKIVSILAVLALIAAGCGDGAQTDDGDAAETTTTAADETTTTAADDPEDGEASQVDQAQQIVDEAMAEATWEGPSDPVDLSTLEGKTIWHIGVGLAIPVVQTYDEALKAAVEASGAGVEVITCDGKLDPAEFARCTEQAITQGADSIVLVAIDPVTIEAELQQAQEAGIPILASHDADPDAPLPEGVEARVSFCHTCIGEQLAAWVIADSGADAEVLIYTVSDATNADYELDGMESTFSELCPDCQIVMEDSPLPTWEQRLPTLTNTLLQQNPGIDYILPMYDNMSTFIVPSVLELDMGDQVQVGSFNATHAVMQRLADGEVVGADVGGANIWMGWAYADALFRMMNGEDVPAYNLPLRLFTSENIDNVDLTSQDTIEDTAYGPVDFRAEFLELWSAD